MNETDSGIIWCLAASGAGAVSFTIRQGTVRSAWQFAVATVPSFLFSACMTHVLVRAGELSGYAPTFPWSDTWTCVGVAYLLGLLAERICSATFSAVEQRSGVLGWLLNRVCGEPEVRKASRPDSDPNGGV